MLIVRSEQMQTMERFALEEFENEMVEHIKAFAPKHSEVIKDEGVREVVRLGIERSEKYGFTNRGPIRFYIEMMCMFGSDFDTDFQLPWAEGTLRNEVIKDQMQRADILHDQMTEYLDRVYGPDDEYSLAALRRLSKARPEDYNLTKQDFSNQMMLALRQIYPQKCDYLGDELMKMLIRRGIELARAHSITSVSGTALMIASMLGLGHGFADDPLFPWISATLKDEAVKDPNERAENLQRRIKIYLDRALKNLEEMRR